MDNGFCFFGSVVLIIFVAFVLWGYSHKSPPETKPHVPDDPDPVRRNLGTTVPVALPLRKPPVPVVAEYERIKDEVAELKRHENYDAALKLLYQSIEPLEQNRFPHFSPWPYEQAAIIYRKRKQYQDEIEIIQRYFRQTDVYPTAQAFKLAQRYPKACRLAGVEIDTSQFERLGLGVDVETTGLYDDDEIIEFAAVLFRYNILTGEMGESVAEYSGLREPKRSIPPSATKIHGLRDSDVRGHHLDESRIYDLWGQARIIVSHNASYDEKFIRRLYPWTQNRTWRCSMDGIAWYKKGHKSKGLQTLLDDYQIGDKLSHRALADVHGMLALLKLRGEDGQFFSELLTVG